MDRTQYIEIRKQLDLRHKQWALTQHLLQNALLASLVAAVWLRAPRPVALFVAIPAVAIFIFRHFSMMHEAVHRVASSNSRANQTMGIFAGAVCLLPFEPWKRSHLEHHTWSGNIEKDPVMAIINAFPKMNPRLQTSLSRLWMLWFPMLACLQYIVFWWLASKIFLKKPKSPQVLVSLAAPILFWAIVFTSCGTSFSLGVLLPALLLYFVAVEVVNFPHHLQLPQHGGDTKFRLWDQHQTARSCVYPHWLARFVVLNFNYHIEHHMYPDVPWYHLEKLHLKVKSALTDSYNTDDQFAWIVANKSKPLGQVLRSANPSDHNIDKKVA